MTWLSAAFSALLWATCLGAAGALPPGEEAQGKAPHWGPPPPLAADTGQTPNTPSGPAVAAPTSEMLQRAQALGREIRCPVCQGMPIGESPATMAQDMQAKVNQMVARGASDAQVREFFVARYGEWVLLDPPRRGVTLWLWVLPWAFLAAGLAMAWRAVVSLRRARPRGAVAPAFAAADSAPEPQGSDAALMDQIRREAQP